MKLKPFVRERNYSILLSGAFINAIGSGVYMIAGMLLVLELTGSVLYSGITMVAVTLPQTIGLLIAPLANYAKYKNGLVYSNFIKSLLILSIPFMHYTIGLNVWYLITILFFVALLSQYTYPIESTILPIIVGEDNVVEANSYLQAVRESMDIIFIASAGIIVIFIGSVNTLMITGICIFLVSILYTLFNFNQPEQSNEKATTLKKVALKYSNDLKDGFSYIQHSVIPKMILSITFINFAMIIMNTNMPAFSLIKGNGSEAAYGFYMAALGAGIMLGTLIAPKIKHFDFGRMVILLYICTGIFWIGTVLLPLLPSIILFSLGAVPIGIVNLLIFSSIQKQVEVAYIGRVITLLTSTAALGMPVGALFGGIIGNMFNPAVSVVFCAISMIIFSISWLANQVLRELPSVETTNIFKLKAIEQK